MAIEFKCSVCGYPLRVADHLAGKKGKCPKCGVSFEVLAPPAALPTPSPVLPTPSRMMRRWGSGKKLLLVATIALMVCLIAGMSVYLGQRSRQIPKSGHEALAALERLSAKTEIDITYVDYTRELGDAYATTRAFLDSKDVIHCPEFARCLKAAIIEFDGAGQTWDVGIQGGRSSSAYHVAELQRTIMWLDAKASLMQARMVRDGTGPDQTYDELGAEIDKLTAEKKEAIRDLP